MLVSFTYEDSNDEFVSLFDGETLNGWHLMNDAQFTVEEGVIKLNGGRGWLRSEKEYSDFILTLQFRFKKPSQNGGVFLRAGLEGNNWPERNYELQMENSSKMASIKGSIHDLNAGLTQMLNNPDGGWNEYYIRLVGDFIEVRLNGELVTISNNMEDLEKGYIGIQGENGIHEYRNIMIKDLSN